MNLYRLTLSGCVTYYLAADAETDCARLIEECEGDGWEPEEEVVIELLSMTEAAKEMIRDDDAPKGQERVPLSVLFEATKTPGVLACSEW